MGTHSSKSNPDDAMVYGEVGEVGIAPNQSPIAAYFTLHDIISDLVERGILSESTAPDDYQAVVAALLKCNAAHEQLKAAGILASQHGRPEDPLHSTSNH